MLVLPPLLLARLLLLLLLLLLALIGLLLHVLLPSYYKRCDYYDDCYDHGDGDKDGEDDLPLNQCNC